MKRVPLLAAIGLSVLTSSAWASPIHTETGDAGPTIATAQLADGGGTPGAISTIIGSLSDAGFPGFPGKDVDIYKIYIADPAGFSARAQANASPGVPDPQLFLFRADGTGVYANDDTTADLSAGLPKGPPGPTTPGYYFLVITQFDNDPMDNTPTLIFPSDPYTGVYGPSNPNAVLAGFSEGSFGTGGNYTIVLTGATHLPEPLSVFILGIAGLAGAGYVWRRRKSA